MSTTLPTLALLALLTASLVGCSSQAKDQIARWTAAGKQLVTGQDRPDGVANDRQTKPDPSPRLALHRSAPAPLPKEPAAVCHAFLLALQNGDSGQVDRLLSGRAQAALADAGLAATAPGSAHAVFHVGSVEYAADRLAAYVNCSWSDERHVAQSLTTVLRYESDRWAIAGFVVDGDEPAIFDLEKPTQFAATE